MKQEVILVLDFGGQYSELIARRVREEQVYCEILPYDTALEVIKGKNPKGIILTGGPSSVANPDSPKCGMEIFELGVPVLGICYGAQLIAHLFGGQVEKAPQREYGKCMVEWDVNAKLFEGLDDKSVCWMSHTDYIKTLPSGFNNTAHTEKCPVAAFEDSNRGIYAVQFHPEVTHTELGQKVIRNFIFNICKCSGDWTTQNFVDRSIDEIKSQVGDGKVLCALSGGVDSSVAAVMVHKAVGDQLTCIFVDHGLLRKDEADQVERVFKDKFHLNLIRVDAQDRFLDRLKGVTDPETKRKIIGEEFIRVFEEEAKKLGKVDFLVQGTIYPDVIESGTGRSATIKSHHNVGGLPENVDFREIIEPLRNLFKDEVRRVGEQMGIPQEIVWRQPFPGPGLAVRVIGDITREKLDILREADAIFREEIANAHLDREIWQYFAVLTGMRSVGVMGDERTYDYTIALRAVNSIDGMTADWAKIPHDVLQIVSNRIVNEVNHVNRVVYDITSKPPATIEWE
jgi:GMP synthase (glutamine-hydrolysing)